MDLIKEFFQITGRPIATMTVDEYLKFKAVMQEGQAHQITGHHENAARPPKGEIKKPVDAPVKKIETTSPAPRSSALDMLKSVSG